MLSLCRPAKRRVQGRSAFAHGGVYPGPRWLWQWMSRESPPLVVHKAEVRDTAHQREGKMIEDKTRGRSVSVLWLVGETFTPLTRLGEAVAAPDQGPMQLSVSCASRASVAAVFEVESGPVPYLRISGQRITISFFTIAPSNVHVRDEMHA